MDGGTVVICHHLGKDNGKQLFLFLQWRDLATRLQLDPDKMEMAHTEHVDLGIDGFVKQQTFHSGTGHSQLPGHSQTSFSPWTCCFGLIPGITWRTLQASQKRWIHTTSPIYQGDNLQGGAPPVINIDYNPINYRYITYKP